jgi:hypothetical protein
MRMDASTRPPQKRHRAKLHLAVSLVAVYFAVTSSHGAVSNQPDPLPATKPLLLAPTLHDIGIATVRPGEEGLELSARFTEQGDELVRDVEWKIRVGSGNEVFRGITTKVDAALAPNDYQVEATYGSSHFVQVISVQPGTRVIVNFVLNAGGLRIMPRINGIAAPGPSHSAIYAASGELIKTSYTPGEIIKLSAGDYRIENRFESGNAVTYAKVHINAGRMSAVEINHQAGLAHLNHKPSGGAELQWDIVDQGGVTLPPISGQDAILKPGHYLASFGQFKTEFDIAAGQTRNINLGN